MALNPLGVPGVFVLQKSSRITELPKMNNNPHNEKETINPRTGKIERVFVNLEAIYPDCDNPGYELSLEELRAQSRGWAHKDWSKQRTAPLKEVTGNSHRKEQPSGPRGTENPDKSLSSKLREKLVIHRDSENAPEELQEAVEQREGKNTKSRKTKVREIRGETQMSRFSSALLPFLDMLVIHMTDPLCVRS